MSGQACAVRPEYSPYKKAIHKLRKLDVGLADSLLSSLYSKTGRPAIDPSILLRSFILMQHLSY